MDYNRIYKNLLSYCEENGIIVKELALGSQWMGEYDCDTNIIRINKNITSPKEKCKVLAHEIGHYLDYTYKTYPNFFRPLGRYTHKKMRLVIRAEQSASLHAIDILGFYGKSVDFEEFDYYLMAFCLAPTWRKIYFSN